MAKKRSKRTSKARRSKRKGKAGAAVPRRAQPKGVINAWEDDPGAGVQPSGGQVIQRPVPVLRDQPLPIRIVHPASAPEATPHPPGTAEFRYWTAAEALRRGADFWRALLPAPSWEVGSILPVDLDFGVDLNAFYDREGLKFFMVRPRDGRSFPARVPTSCATSSGMPFSIRSSRNCSTPPA